MTWKTEAKESVYWLSIIKENNDIAFKEEADKLIKEAVELKKIFSSIIDKCN